MSRRPEDISPQSQLVYQEGKQIEGEAYIMSVYEDPSQCRLTFAAYELETDQVYTLPYSYAQLDEIFQFNSELVNPNNRDARYHWIIERLDFVLVDLQKGTKTLTLAMEKTPESAAPKMKAKVKGELTSTIDAELRAKLLGELATYDTSALQSELVKSEGARKTFLRELFAKRRIEQLKAQQRQVKVDEVREERRAKLMSNKVLLEEKALKYKQEQEQRSATLASIEQMMRQKDLAAVRKLREQKLQEEEERQVRLVKAKRKKMEGRMNMAKQREAAAAKYRETEELRRQEIDKRKDDIHKVTLDLCTERRRKLDEQIALRKVRAEKRSQYVMVLEDVLDRRRAAARAKDEAWQKIEDVRWKRELERDARRTSTEFERWEQKQQEAAARETRRRVDKDEAIRKYWEAHRTRCKETAQRKRTQGELDLKRSQNIDEKMRLRAQRMKHEQWLLELKPKNQLGMTLLSGQTAEQDTTAEASAFKHAEARDDRLRERDTKLSAKQQKVDKMLKNSQKFRDQQEVDKLNTWKEEQHQHSSHLEDTRARREEANERVREQKGEKARLSGEIWERLQQVREEKFTRKDEMLKEQALNKYKLRPPGMAIPMNM